MSDVSCTIAGENLLLLPEKAIFWKKERALILSDLHLGKAGHFRKHGIPISGKIHKKDLEILNRLIESHQPSAIYLLGDLFHSFENNEWSDFLTFLDVHESIDFTLVEGNHDILKNYPEALTCVDLLEIGPFSFSHEKIDSPLYNLSGHIHPGVRVRGKGRQQITMPCFYFSSHFGVLPAFGQFTGVANLKVHPTDRVYGVAERRVIELT